MRDVLIAGAGLGGLTAALALIQRAQPLPALPADFPTRTLDAIVPIEFSLNRP